jgi:hypothetical protein
MVIRTRKGKKGNTYQVTIRPPCQPHISKTFKTKAEAKEFDLEMQVLLKEGNYSSYSESSKKTFSDAINRYRKYVLPSITKSKRENIITWWERTLGTKTLNQITPALVTEIRDQLLHSEIDQKKKIGSNGG